MSHSKFGGNQAHDKGGAVTIEFNNFIILCFVSFKNCSFWDNMAIGGGGGIFSQTFTDCQAEFYLINSTFVHNSAKEGGALSISHKNYQDDFGRYEDLYITPKEAASIFISYSNFVKNSGTAGGALNLFGVDKLRVSDSNFAHNMARNIKNITANCESSQQYYGAGGAITIRP